MTTHLRIIHDEHRADATAPDNAMRHVPEVVRVWTPSPGVLGYVGTDSDSELNRAAKTGLIWHQDLLRGFGLSAGFPQDAIKLARKQIQTLVAEVEFAGLNPATITLCSDWEAWSSDPVWDYGNWKAAVQDWPGPTANFGNAIANVPAMFHWPTASASCYASHGTGTTPSMTRDGIKVCKPVLRKQKSVAIACVADPAFFATPTNHTGERLHTQYLTASKRADFVIHWPLWPGDDERAKVAGYRKQQDKIIAQAIGVN